MQRKRKRGIYRLLLLCAALSGLLCGCGSKAEQTASGEPQYVFSYADNHPAAHPAVQGAYRFAQLVEERSEGRIRIIVYENAQLGDETSVIEQLKYGGIDFARVSVMTMGEFLPRLNVLQLPYLYEDAGHMWRVLDGEIGDELMQDFEACGMKALSWYDAGSRNFYTVEKPIEKLEDMAGMRIRVAESELMECMVRALGAQPVSMVYSEVYSALETGTIDGAENNWPSYESAGHYKAAGYMTMDEHNRIPEVQLAAASTWEKLSEQDRALLEQCARESAEYQRTLWKQKEEEARRICENAGCVVTELDDREKKRFRNAMATVYEDFVEEYGDLVERILAEGNL